MDMRLREAVCAIAAAGALVGAVPSAQAFVFGTFVPANAPVGNPAIFNVLPTVQIGAGDVGDSFVIDWLLATGQSGFGTDLKATATFTVQSFGSGGMDLGINITNTTDGNIQAAILAFGFSTDPDTTVDFAPGGAGAIFDDVGPAQGGQQTFPGGFH